MHELSCKFFDCLFKSIFVGKGSFFCNFSCIFQCVCFFSKLKNSLIFFIKLNYVACKTGQRACTDNKKALSITLKYKGKNAAPVIEGIRRISKPSRRVYVNSAEIPRVLGGLGVAILTTSQGVVTDRTARKRNIGGELLCYVW